VPAELVVSPLLQAALGALQILDGRANDRMLLPLLAAIDSQHRSGRPGEDGRDNNHRQRAEPWHVFPPLRCLLIALRA